MSIKEGRIQGARKINGRTWGIPLYKGKPRVSGRKRGPKPNWYPRRHCGKNTIHFNRPNIEKNRKLKKVDPQAKCEYVLSAQRGSEILSKGHEVEINGPCRIVYRPDKPHSCGATVWIETLATVTVFNFDGTVERVNNRWVWEEEEMWKINKKNIEELI
ncbi:MAG: DNA-binding protein [Okeania sp. SIO2G4]|uniref:DNA-binding protein n=1 Tax=unclassified Okeania TaxID=2634635 RepID=UPI0013B9247C|nr:MULTISPECIES: DNA-binding protein [unclassified Okeania]NEP03680.1 DNA-binding protein [Okeania sp. SIO4D6]NEP40193.1 DNA-binding protein [Okeania sp. SIO2H7]NEP74390.1 DNA-binding protein [Okeania sp. SIO2G5]NEP95503.1 DNA-binding protein [Okeania sp. SIO2F5]NEQ93408.1 DNA-binding protein [Okeania sp. SIO2G4]